MPRNNVIWNSPQGFEKGTLSGSLTSDALDDATKNDSNVLEDWLFPHRKEERQLGQEIALMYEEPSIRMEAAKKAGINPLTAAGGIAGSSPSSSPQPSSSVNPIGDVAGAAGTAAAAFQSVAGGISTLGKLNPEIGEINSSAQKNLAAAGLDKVNTDAVMTDNKYRADNWESELNIKRQRYQNMRQELSNMKATHREIMTHCDEMISQIELNGSSKDYYDAMQLKIQEDLRWQKALDDWCLSNNLMIRDSGVDGYLFNMLYNDAPDGDVDAFFDSYYVYCKNRSYAISKGQFDADVDTAWERFKNQAEGTAFGDLVHGKRKADLENYKTLFDVMCQLYYGSGNTETALLSKIFNLAATMFNLDVNDVRNMFIDATNPK